TKDTKHHEESGFENQKQKKTSCTSWFIFSRFLRDVLARTRIVAVPPATAAKRAPPCRGALRWPALRAAASTLVHTSMRGRCAGNLAAARPARGPARGRRPARGRARPGGWPGPSAAPPRPRRRGR